MLNTDTKKFTVYKELMTARKSEKEDNVGFYYKRGNFLPYNTFDQMLQSRLKNQYDAMGNELSTDSERYNETLYLPDGYDQSGKGAVQYEFGMELSAAFIQTESGYYDGQPIRYEFTGDDDLWVYVDGVLVLDMGGCHDARSGYIDFSTGEVWVQGVGYYTTIRDMFDAAGITDVKWQEVELPEDTQGYSKDGKGYIFEDFSRHEFKMWYMERGQGASNLKIKFNLPVIPEETVEVEKIVENTEGTEVNYAEDVDFQFNIQVGNEKLENWANKDYVVYEDEKQVDTGTTDKDGNFTLKHGQTARFSGISANSKYQVKELGAYLNGYKVYVNNTEVYVPSTDNTTTAAASPELMVSKNPYVVFKNKVENTGTLTLEKTIATGSEAAFEGKVFKIFLEINDVPYSQTYNVYEDGVKPETKTAVDGVILLEANQKAEIAGLPFGVLFDVEEEKDSTYYAKYYLDGDYYDEQVPEYDAETGLVSNNVTGVSGKLAGDCEVEVNNKEVRGGTTTVTVNKNWAENINREDWKQVQITLYGNGSAVEREDNPITLSDSNEWSHTWDSLPGDTDYTVQESYGDGFEFTVNYSYDYSINSEWEWVKKCSQTYFSLGTNAVIAIKGQNRWIIWTSEKVEDSFKQNLIDAVNNTPDKSGNSITKNNCTFLNGTTTGKLQGEDINFQYDSGTLELEYGASNSWSFFGYGTYNKTVTVSATNSIDEDAVIEIPVEKIWVGDTEDDRPADVTVQLYRIDGTSQTLVENKNMTLNKENSWKGVFEDLPYWDTTTNRAIRYTVKEALVDGKALENSGYMSSVTGDMESGFVITNTKVTPWQIVKISSSRNDEGQKIPLKDAQFTLTNKEEPTKIYYGKSEESTGIIQWYTDAAYSTPVEGLIANGTYVLEEIQAPIGYSISELTWEITIVNGAPISIVDSEGNPILEAEGEEPDTYYFENDPLYELPSAGGPGIFLYMIGGTLLLIAGSLMIYINRRKGVLKK